MGERHIYEHFLSLKQRFRTMVTVSSRTCAFDVLVLLFTK